MATGEGSCRVLISKVCHSLQGCFVILTGVNHCHTEITFVGRISGEQ